MQCARHSGVETGLACGRCETPICPKCAVMTDVGARCPSCAPTRKLPQFELSPLLLLRGAGAALVSGTALGSLWAFLLPGGLGFLALILAFVLGYAVGEAVSWATNRKSGPALQIEAAAGVVLAYIVRNLVIESEPVLTDDLIGYVAIGLAVIVAVNRLRY